MEERPVLVLNDVTRSYISSGKELTVLNKVSFAINHGDSVAIVGPSGSGKTTLLGLCAGLDQVSSGDVTLAGKKLNDLDEDARAELRNEYIGFVFQDFQLIPTLTALENVTIPLELRNEAHPETVARQLLIRVGLQNRENHYPSQLSGGEQQRVSIARAFSNRPLVLFADEPTGNLDNDTGSHIEDLLFEINREQGTTLIIVTHNLELAQRCNRIIRLRSGQIYSDTLITKDA